MNSDAVDILVRGLGWVDVFSALSGAPRGVSLPAPVVTLLSEGAAHFTV